MTKFLLTLFLGLSASLNAVQKPNILIIIADDCTFSDLPINGGQNAKTPHLELSQPNPLSLIEPI